MTGKRINDLYFKFLKDMVCDASKSRNYNKLLQYLHTREFTWINTRDANRAEYGIELRKRFVYENGYDFYAYDYLDGPCSVLEMMVALADMWENQIMWDGIEDRTYLYFWEMIENLGLLRMNNALYDEEFVCEVIDILLDRRYSRDGKGSLFYIPNFTKDLRVMEIWSQLNWYISYKDSENL